MSKFGELISVKIPVLIDFYAEWSDVSTAMQTAVKKVAAALGDKAKVVRMDVDKNEELINALKIKGVPTLMIYKEGKLVWRKTEELDANALIVLLQEYL